MAKVATKQPSGMEDWTTPRGGGSDERDEALAGRLLSWWNAEATQRKAAQRLIDWYNRDRTKIIDYLKTQASVTFGDRTAEWQFPIVNGVQRTVRRLAMTYKRPPERKYFRGDDELKPDDPQLENIERMYQGLDLNKRLREAERMMILLNTVHVEVVYRRGRIDWDIRKRPDVVVITSPDDFLHYDLFARRIYLPQDPANPLPQDSKRAAGFMVWTDERYVFVRDDGFMWSIVPGSDDTNPFIDVKREALERPIPVITMRKTQGEDYWGRHGADIVDGFEQANIQLGNWWEDGFMQSGIVLLTNTKLGEKNKGQKIAIGLKEPLTVEGALKQDLPPNIEFKRPETPLDIIQAMIEKFVNWNSASYGMPPSTWADKEALTSGYSKRIDQSELLEDRDEGLTDQENIEAALFEASRMTWNKWHPDTSEHVDEDIICKATFDEIEFDEAPSEEAMAAATEIQNNLSSPVDWIMKKYKISDRDKALEKALEITEENAMIQARRMKILGPTVPGVDENGDPLPAGGEGLDRRAGKVDPTDPKVSAGGKSGKSGGFGGIGGVGGSGGGGGGGKPGNQPPRPQDG